MCALSTALFTSPCEEPLPATEVLGEFPTHPRKSTGRGSGKLSVADAGDAAMRLSESGVTPDQFCVFQLSTKAEGPTILDSTEVEPVLAGETANPDILMSAEMVSFHLGQDEDLDPDTRATLRMNIGKDESSTDKRFETVFWAVAAGLNLFNESKGTKSESKELKADFSKAFANRPIEIPGGLARLTFDIVKHKEPPWWKRVFSFLRSGTGTALVSTLGFPALTSQAIGVIDELLDRLTESEPEILFKGAPMRLALTKQARLDFTGGSPRVKLGALNRGFSIFVRGRDFVRVANSNSIYYPSIGRLAPADATMGQVNSGKFNDPLANTTYAVFRIGTRETKLDPTFSYQA